MALTHGSLFSGIGGFDLGFERAGIHTAWQVERDKYCRYVLRQHFPWAKQFRDVRRVGKHNLAPVDVISGGFPCQPFSLAGKRRGEADNRFLWPEMFRVIDELRPPWVVGENVPGMVRMALDRVLADLEGIGYACWPVVIPACAVGAPHIRKRVWIIAYSERNALRNESRRRDGADGSNAAVTTNDGEQGILADTAIHRRQQGAEILCARKSITIDTGEDVPHAVGCPHRRLHGGRSDEAKAPELTGRGEDLADTKQSEWWRGSRSRRRRGRQENSQVFGWAGSSQANGQWAVEPDVGGTLDGFSAWLDGYGGLNAASKVDLTAETVCILWDRILAQEPGIEGGISAEKVLLTFLCKLKNWQFNEARIQLACAEASQEILRGVWPDTTASCPSCRSGQVKQHAREHSDFVQVVSPLLARLSEKAWAAYRRSDAAPILGWETGYTRIAAKVPNRVQRLKALGNAVVPQITEVFGRLIVEASKV